MLDGGALIVAHAGIEEHMIGKTDPETRRFVLNGDAIGKSPEGKTLRRDWAADYQGEAFIVYGHTPQERAEIRERTVNIDTGAYRGGLLTALRWPEHTLVSVPSRLPVSGVADRRGAQPRRPEREAVKAQRPDPRGDGPGPAHETRHGTARAARGTATPRRASPVPAPPDAPAAGFSVPKPSA